MYLSSAYEYPVEDPDLELRVTVLNVNDGHNKDLMEQCHTLKEYAQYVARVRKYTSSKEFSLEEAVERAVDECIHEGILAEFLIKNRAEVISMSMQGYDDIADSCFQSRDGETSAIGVGNRSKGFYCDQ